MSLALKAIQEKREKYLAALERLDENERELRIKLGLPVRRERSTQDEIEDIRARVMAYMESHAGNWMGIDEIATAVTSESDHEEATVRTQIHTLAHDTSTRLVHNGERGRGSRYVYVCEGDALPITPSEIERRQAWILNSIRSLRESGKLLCGPDDILNKLHEHEGLRGITHTDLEQYLEIMVSDSDKLKRIGDEYLLVG